MDVSVIFATYNREDVIEAVLDKWRKVRDVTKYKFEIICSDDESSDRTIEFIKKATDLPITLIRNRKGGAGKARNAALKVAKGKIVIFTGDDMFPEENFINAHYENYLRFGDNVATLGRIEWHEEININHLMYHITNVGCEQFGFIGLPPYQLIDFRHFYTSNISVSRKKINSLDIYFDTTFDKYGFEDIELGYRLEKQGVKIYYDPDIIINHHHIYSSGEKFCVRQLNAGEELVVFNDIHDDLEDKCIIDINNYKEAFRLYCNDNNVFNYFKGSIIEIINFFAKKSTSFIEKMLCYKSSTFLMQTCSLIYAGIFKYAFFMGAAKKIAENTSYSNNGIAYFTYKYMKKGYTQIYYNTGEGFNERESRKWVCWNDDLRVIELELPSDKVKGIRISPLKNQCKAEVADIWFQTKENNKIKAKVAWHNSCNSDLNKYDFTNTIDPQIIIEDIPSNYEKICIELKVNDMKRKNIFTAIKKVAGKFYRSHKVKIGSASKWDVEYEYGQPRRVQIGINCAGAKNICQEKLINQYRKAISIFGDSIIVSPLNQMQKDYSDYIYNPIEEPFDTAQFNQIAYTLLNTPYDYIIASKAFTEFPVVACKMEEDIIIFSRLLGEELKKINFEHAVGRYMRLPSFKLENITKEITQISNILHDEYIISKRISNPKFRISERNFVYSKKKPMVFVIPVFLAVGGVERNTIEVMRELKEEFEFCLITLEHHDVAQGSLHYQLEGICDYIFDLKEITEHRNYMSVLFELKKIFNPDILWICNNSPWLEENLIKIRNLFSQTPIVMQDVYDTEVGWIEYYNTVGIKRCDRFIAVTEKIKNTFVEKYDIEEEKIDVIYSVVDAKKIEQEKEKDIEFKSICSKYNLDINKKHYATIGRLTEQKDPIRYLELIKKCNEDEKLSDIQFIVVGDGVLRDEIQDFIKQNNIGNRVTHIPYIENTPQFIKFLDGLILTSVYEGMPIVSIEAMCMGTPIFSTDTGDLRRFMDKTNGGVIIEEKKSDYQNFVEFYKNIEIYKKNSQMNREEILNFFSVIFQSNIYRQSFTKSMRLYEKED